MSYNIPKIGSLTEFTSVDSNPISLIPARYNIMSALGLFTAKFHNTNTFNLERIEYKDYTMDPVRWGTAVKNVGKNIKGYLPLVIPHYGVEDAILPEDIAGKYDWRDILATERKESVQGLFEQKMATMKQAMVNTWNNKFLQLVIDGTAVRDDLGTLVNYYTEFGVIRKTVTMTLSDETLDPMPAIYEAVDHVKDTFRGGYIPNRFICLAERTLFDAIERHPYTVDSYKYFAQTQSVAILNQGLDTQGKVSLDTRYKVLDFGGVMFIRVDSKEMTAGEGRLFPVDVPDLFEVHFANSRSRFSTANAVAQDMYYWEEIEDDKRVGMEIETNFLPVLRWPDAVVRIIKA